MKALRLAAEPKTFREIRATHPWALRAGEWARLGATAWFPGFPEGDRLMYVVRFPDGLTDFWPVHPVNGVDKQYEFR